MFADLHPPTPPASGLTSPTMPGLDRIHIEDLSVMGIIGINPDEQVTPQQIRVNATLHVDTRPAAASDDIADAANYRTITKALIAHIEDGKPLLVERLAEELAEVVFATDANVQVVEIRVDKPDALRHARSVGISITRTRV